MNMTTKEQIREIINNSPIPKGINAMIIANKIYALHKQKVIEFLDKYRLLNHITKASCGSDLTQTSSELFDLFEQENNK